MRLKLPILSGCNAVCQMSNSARMRSTEFRCLRPEEPTAGVGFSERGQLAPFPPVRALGSAISSPSWVRGSAPAAQRFPRLWSHGNTALYKFCIVLNCIEVSRQLILAATLLTANSCRSPSICQQWGLRQPPGGRNYMSRGGLSTVAQGIQLPWPRVNIEKCTVLAHRVYACKNRVDCVRCWRSA